MGNDVEKKGGSGCDFSPLLELSAANDLIGFKRAVEEDGFGVDEPGLWYGRKLGSRKTGFEERTPLMIAALYGSKDVLQYILESGCAEVNKASGSDGATALHFVAAGCSSLSLEIVKLLLNASADPNSLDSSGNRPCDLIASVINDSYNVRRKELEIMIKDSITGDEWHNFPDQIIDVNIGQEQREITMPKASKDGVDKKEYPIDPTIPDINDGIYGTDEFRMYTFKVQPCSRAYSHDWTECPFVHPGENARRRDPRKYNYSCVPCPEFRKGSCKQGDNCEYAHGIFECWLHPAQYRTRLCKDETSCTRKVCFFAHKPEELRPLYALTGSGIPSPRLFSVNGSISNPISPISLGSPSGMRQASTPPLTPPGSSSLVGGWPNQPPIAPPTLQLSGSRLRSARCARKMDLGLDLLGTENHHSQRQQLKDEISGFSLSSSWNNGLPSPSSFVATPSNQMGEFNRLGGIKPTNIDNRFGLRDSTILPPLQGVSMDAPSWQLHSPSGIHVRENVNQLLSNYPNNFSSSPVMTSPSFGIIDGTVATTAATLFSSGSAAFAKRSRSLIEGSVANQQSGFLSPVSAASQMSMPFDTSDWGSPNGKLDWSIQGDELNKLQKSASFAYRSNANNFIKATVPISATIDEPDVSWVHSLVKDTPLERSGPLGFEEQLQQQKQQCHLHIGGSETVPTWMEQLYTEHEQMVA